MKKRFLPGYVLGFVLCGLGGLFVSMAGCKTPAGEQATPAYVGRESCVECHQAEVKLWTGSHHDRAMEVATPETVLGDFSGVTFTEPGGTTRFFRQGNRFFAFTEGPEGRPDTFQVKYTFGFYPLQQYLVELDRGHIQALTVAWDSKTNRWFSLYPNERLKAGEWLHWTGGAMNWNYMCADCHSTDLRKNFDLATNSYHTTWKEIDVSCETCHGPAGRHVELARKAKERGRTSMKESGFLTNLDTQQKVIESCAPCHSRRRVIAADFMPGKRYLDHYQPELLEEALYFPDGQIKDEVYEYGSFTQSVMYRRGVMCSNCHNSHSMKVKYRDNRLCTQCHVSSNYDGPIHTHHPKKTLREFAQGQKGDGTFCVDCHMPERTYMVVDPRRDHSMQLPRPDLASLGVPDVCSSCHADKTPKWAAEQIVKWYGPTRRHEPHFALAFVAGRRHEASAEAHLVQIVSDTSRAGIVRATAASILGGYTTDGARIALQQALKESDPLIRSAAVRALESRPDNELYEYLAPALSDPLRLVRIEAARVLSRLGKDRMSGQKDFHQALAEYRESQRVVSDQPAAHLNLAVVHENLGQPDSAETEYRTAFRLDSTFVPARFNLAMLYDRQRQEAIAAGDQARVAQLTQAAEKELRTAVRLQPESAEAYYTLGLLVAESPERLAEAAGLLERAAALDTANARAHYNAGLAYQQLGQAEKAERLLIRAHRLMPQQPDFLNALSIFYIQQKRWREALRFTEQLIPLAPGDASLQERLAYIRGQSNGR